MKYIKGKNCCKIGIIIFLTIIPDNCLSFQNKKECYKRKKEDFPLNCE